MPRENRLKSARKAVKLTQAQVADALGITPQAVSGWETGGRPDQDHVPELARLYKKSANWILEGKEIDQATSGEEDVRSEDVAAGLDKPEKRGVRIVGYVGAGAKGHFYGLAHDEYAVVDPPPGVTEKTVAVEIKGKSFGPLLDTWLVYYDDVRSPVEPDLYGEVCVIGLSDDRVLIKKILSNGRGGFTLESNSGEDPIENAEIEWAAKVIDMRPR